MFRKGKKKKAEICKEDEGEVDPKKTEKLRKKVSDLIRQQKRRQMRHIVNKEDDSKSWGHSIKAQV